MYTVILIVGQIKKIHSDNFTPCFNLTESTNYCNEVYIFSLIHLDKITFFQVTTNMQV